jgi:hypothetical protein
MWQTFRPFVTFFYSSEFLLVFGIMGKQKRGRQQRDQKNNNQEDNHDERGQQDGDQLADPPKALIALHPDGIAVALAVGPELRVHDGRSANMPLHTFSICFEHTKWRKMR